MTDLIHQLWMWPIAVGVNVHSVELSTYTCYMFLIGEVKIVHFVLERVEDLTMPGHVSSQNQCDDRL